MTLIKSKETESIMRTSTTLRQLSTAIARAGVFDSSADENHSTEMGSEKVGAVHVRTHWSACSRRSSGAPG